MATATVGPPKDRREKGYVTKCLALYEAWIAKHKMPDCETSLIEWDKTQNQKQLLDWDKERGFQRDLISQARLILTVYTRVMIKYEGKTTSWPTKLKNDDHNFQKPEEMTKTQIAAIIESWKREFAGGYIRLRLLGAGKKAIIRAMFDAIRDADRGFKKDS